MKIFLMIFLIGILSISNLLFPYEGDGNPQIMRDCNTKGPTSYYDSTTKVTFYGDSRMDYVNQPESGTRPNGDARTMADILNIPLPGQPAYTGADIFQDNDIQNLGANSWTASAIRDHLERCLKPEKADTYRIANRFVYHTDREAYLDEIELGLPHKERVLTDEEWEEHLKKLEGMTEKFYAEVWNDVKNLEAKELQTTLLNVSANIYLIDHMERHTSLGEREQRIFGHNKEHVVYLRRRIIALLIEKGER